MIFLDPTLYTLFRRFSGLFVTICGLAHMTKTGRRLFPRAHNYYLKSCRSYYNAIPWALVPCRKINLSLFQDLLAFFLLVAGVCLLLRLYVDSISRLMAAISWWGVYAHLRRNDPGYLLAMPLLLAVSMLTIATAKRKRMCCMGLDRC